MAVEIAQLDYRYAGIEVDPVVAAARGARLELIAQNVDRLARSAAVRKIRRSAKETDFPPGWENLADSVIPALPASEAPAWAANRSA